MKIIRLGANWCPECVIMRPRWEEAAKTFPEIEMEFIDIDERPEAKKAHQLDHVPTYIFLDASGREILRLKGLVETKDLIIHIRNHQDK